MSQWPGTRYVTVGNEFKEPIRVKGERPGWEPARQWGWCAESCLRPPWAGWFLSDINRLPARNHFCSLTQFLPLGKVILCKAVSLKGAWFVIRVYCQGERKFLLLRKCQAGDGAKWSQDPHFLQQWSLCVKGAGCQDHCWGHCLLPSIAGPQAFGEFQTEARGRKRTSPRDPRHLLGVLVRDIMVRPSSFLMPRCSGDTSSIRAEPL